MTVSPRRWRPSSVAVVLISAIAATGAVMLAAPAPAQAAIGECPEGTIPAPGTSNPIWSDNNVAIYAGGDFLVRGAAAEVEGLVVIEGDMDVAKQAGGTFNVGWVGVGSSVVPTPGSVMLAVGGDLSIAAGNVVDVGANAIDGGELRGGAVNVGGTTSPDYEVDGTRMRLNNGVLQQGMGSDATAQWDGWGDQLVSESEGFAALAANGTADVTSWRLTLNGDGTSADQVFTIPSSALRQEIEFTGIPDGARVIINVTGADPITWGPNYIGQDGERVDIETSPIFGDVAQRTMWNFTEATSLHLAGTSQIMGTILLPSVDPDGEASLRVTAHTNGRLYTNGTILMDGVGNEHHNYPWLDEPFDCIPDPGPPVEPLPELGDVTIAKAVSAEDAAILPDDLEFIGIVRCEFEGDEIIAEWHVLAAESQTIQGLPVGASCTAIEHLGPGTRQRAAPAVPVPRSPAATSGFTWQTPMWNPSPPTFTVPAATGTQVSFTVTNAIVRGAFTVTKTVTGAGVPTGGAFAGTWSCELPGGTVVAEGSWTATAGDVDGPFEAPVGAVCTVAETPPTDPEGGAWQPAQIDPASASVTEASAEEPIAVTVTNEFVRDTGGFSVAKTVVGPVELVAEQDFTGTWSCALGEESWDGTWATTVSGAPATVEAIPLGATCTVTEDTPTAPAGGTWGESVITPATFEVTTAGELIEVTVTNTLRAVLPTTGGVPAWWALNGGLALVALGAGGVSIARRRRRRV